MVKLDLADVVHGERAAEGERIIGLLVLSWLSGKSPEKNLD